jgi:hypothetical protein
METEKHTVTKPWLTKVIREEIKMFLDSNKNENTTYQNLW